MHILRHGGDPFKGKTMSNKVETASKGVADCAPHPGHRGTDFRQIRDAAVPRAGVPIPQDSAASDRSRTGANVPVLGKVSEGLSRNNNERSEPTLLVPFDASDHPRQSSLNSDYEAAKAACIALCDRVVNGELPRMVLRNTYRGEENSHRDMLQRRFTKERAIVCDQWLTFEGFLRTFGPAKVKGWTVNRKNPADPEYSPEKCEWAPKRVQTRDRRNTVLIVNAKGVARTPEEWQKHSKGKLKADTLRKRKRRGWTDLENLAGCRARSSLAVSAEDSPPKRAGETNKGEFEATWRETMAQLYPGESHTLTARERAMLESLRKSLVDDGFGYLHYPEDVLQYALRNWPSIMTLAKREGLRKSEIPTVSILAGCPRIAVNAYMQANDLMHENGALKPRPVQNDSHVWAYKPHRRKMEVARRERERAERIEAEEKEYEAFKDEVNARIASSLDAIHQHELAFYPVYPFVDAAYACKVLRHQIERALSGGNRKRLFVFERQLDYWRARLPPEQDAERTVARSAATEPASPNPATRRNEVWQEPLPELVSE